MPENNIPENENSESAEIAEVSASGETNEAAEDKKAPRKPNYLLQLIASGYLTYLGITLLMDVFKNGADMNPRWLFAVFSVLFILVGGVVFIRCLLVYYKQFKANQNVLASGSSDDDVIEADAEDTADDTEEESSL